MRVEEVAVGFVAVEDVEPAGRLTRPRFGGTFSFLTPFAASFGAFSFSVSVSISDVIPGVSSPDKISERVSSCWGTSGVSTSAILQFVQ